MGGGHLPSLPDTRYSPANHCSIVLENFMTVLFNLTSDPKFRGGGGVGIKICLPCLMLAMALAVSYMYNKL